MLKLDVFDKDTFGSDELEGILRISLKELDSQEKVEDEFNLYKEDGSIEKGRLRLKLHLVWSRYEYFSNLNSRTEFAISQLRQELGNIEAIIKSFEQPFGLILSGEISNMVNQNIITKENLVEKKKLSVAYGSNMSRGDFATSLGNMISGTFSDKFIKIQLLLSGVRLQPQLPLCIG